MTEIDFELRGDFIALHTLLKVTGTALSGGAAKAMVVEGKVQVDNKQELKKSCKVRAGQVVTTPGARVRLLAPA